MFFLHIYVRVIGPQAMNISKKVDGEFTFKVQYTM